MGYLRCESCGAKALSAASTCPRCTSPFNLHDGRGLRVSLKKCAGCGIMHRRDRTCHWCGEQTRSTWRSPAVMRSATGIAAVALVAIGSWSIRENVADVLASAFAVASTPGAPDDQPAYSVNLAPQSASATTLTPVAPPSEAVPDSLVIASADGALVPADTIEWVPAVARTWVNVRRDASRIGDVVGVIKPSEKAMLGIGRSGWRQVKSPEISGWVDPRLFEADSLRTRG